MYNPRFLFVIEVPLWTIRGGLGWESQGSSP